MFSVIVLYIFWASYCRCLILDVKSWRKIILAAYIWRFRRTNIFRSISPSLNIDNRLLIQFCIACKVHTDTSIATVRRSTSFCLVRYIPFYARDDLPGDATSPKSLATHATRAHFIAKGQPRAMNRALSCRWQHAAIYLPRVPRVAPTSRAATSSLARERLSSPLLASSCLASPPDRRARKQRVFAACALLRTTAFLPPFFAHTRVHISSST